MLPHSLSVVVTSFTKGISAAITSSSSLWPDAWKIQQQKKCFLGMDGGFQMYSPSFLNDDLLKVDKIGWEQSLEKYSIF